MYVEFDQSNGVSVETQKNQSILHITKIEVDSQFGNFTRNTRL